MNKSKAYIELHILLLVYSMGAVCSKFASQSDFMSLNFVLFYSIVLADLAIYAVVWQQILKKLPLVSAYANKAVTVIWGLIWGMVVFKEKLTIWNVIGAVIIIIGIYIVVRADADK